jgi:hypothetical protein
MGLAHLSLALIALAGCGTAQPLGSDVVARVDAEEIPAGRYQRALAALAVQERAPVLTAAHRARLLDELIDDALLREKAATEGLHPLDGSPAEAVLAPVPPASEADLRRYYADHPERFAHEPSWQVEALRFTGPDAETRAESAAQAWSAGEAVDVPRLDVPAGPLPLGPLEQYVGPTAARAAARLAPGEVAHPSRYASGWLVLRLVSVVPGEPAPFEEVRPAAAALLGAERQRAARDAVLAGLRAGADVQINAAVRDAPIPQALLVEAARAESGR